MKNYDIKLKKKTKKKSHYTCKMHVMKLVVLISWRINFNFFILLRRMVNFN